MAKRKAPQAARKPAPAPKKKGLSKGAWIAIVAVAIVGLVMVIGNSAGKGKGGAGSIAGAPADEQKYIGRFLPASYVEPSLSGVQAYTSTVKMTDVTPAVNGTDITVPASAVKDNKIVYFEYTRKDGQTIPLVAYVKPSGKLFVAVSFCPPCKGKGQRIEAGGTLVCETCGTVRNLESGVGISGACKLYPLDELPAAVNGNNIVVQTAALEDWTAQPIDRKVGG